MQSLLRFPARSSVLFLRWKQLRTMPPKGLKRKADKERGAESKEGSGPQIEQQSSNKPEQTPEELARDTAEGGESKETGTKRPQQNPTSEAPAAKRGKGRSKKNEGGGETEGAAKKQKGRAKKEPTDGGVKASSSKVTDWESIKWNELGQTKDARPWTKKISSWNVNGIRAWLKNGGMEYVKREDPDIFCVQETKCQEADLPKEELNIPGYHIYWHMAEKKGYSGVGLYSKEKPLNVTLGIGIDKYDCEGRLITAEYEKFFLLTSYVPNAGEGLKRLDFKQAWDIDFRAYLKKLDAQKPLILCGDLNVAHQEIDLANPKTNTGTAGFTKEEREDFSLLLKEGFVDSFRHLYPDVARVYTYWSYRFNARAKNTGWRLDYFVISERLVKDLCDCVARTGVYGSDHCPLVLSMAMD